MATRASSRPSAVSIAFRLLKRLVVVAGPRRGQGGAGEVSIAFRLLKRLVAVFDRDLAHAKCAACLNCLSAVEAIGSEKRLPNCGQQTGMVSIAFRLLKRLVEGVHGQDSRLLLRGVSIAFRLLKRLVDRSAELSLDLVAFVSIAFRLLKRLVEDMPSVKKFKKCHKSQLPFGC